MTLPRRRRRRKSCESKERSLVAFFFGFEKQAKIAKVYQSQVLFPSQRALEERLVTLLKSCKTWKSLSQIHSQIFINGLEHNTYISPNTVKACTDLNRIDYARKVFDRIPNRNVWLWNNMLRGYAKSGLHREVVVLFKAMNRSTSATNRFTYPLVIKSCAKIGALIEGQEVHCVLIKVGFIANQYASASLIEMYSGGGKLIDAHKMFVEMPDRNVVAWTLIIKAYVASGEMTSARRLFDLAPSRDAVMWNTLVCGYAAAGDATTARELFDATPCRDVMSWNAMLECYAKNGFVDELQRLFESAPVKNIFSWNALIGGYAKSGRFSDVLLLFKRMLCDEIVVPNDATMVNVLMSCARLGALDLGAWAHKYAESLGYRDNVFVNNALVDMYAKCGVVESAIAVFEEMKTKDLISWNSMICGSAVHGQASQALTFFGRMRLAGVKPDGITFVGILSACAHLGLVEDGLSYFHSIQNDHRIEPQIEHYGCVVDLLARAGLLKQALEMISTMPLEPDAVVWAALLGACKIHKNIEIAELALKRLIELEPKNPANYVMLSNVYGDLGRWDDVARLKVAMRDTGFKKTPACSVIEVNDSVVEFYTLDERHPKTREIFAALTGMTLSLRSLQGFAPEEEEELLSAE